MWRCFFLASFLADLRGEETLKIILGETKDHLKEGQDCENHKHVIIPLRGKFKGEVVRANRIRGCRLGRGLNKIWSEEREEGWKDGFCL